MISHSSGKHLVLWCALQLFLVSEERVSAGVLILCF